MHKTDEPRPIEARQVRPAGARFRKHFLDLDGRGIRELTSHGGDLLILSGPTMDLDGLIALHRWQGAMKTDQPEVLSHDRLQHLMDLPVGEGVDQPEGLAVLPAEDDATRIIVMYDSPAARRLYDDGTSIDADVFSMPRATFEAS